MSKSGDKKCSELGSKEGVEEGPLEITKKRSFLKWKVDELGSKWIEVNGGTNSDRISLETAGEQEPGA